MPKTFNINDKELVAYTNKLEKMRKFDLPLAVRGALNDTAFDMKKNTLESRFASEFIIRRKTFLRSNTGVNKVDNTFDIDHMKSEAGVMDKREAAKRLVFQEFGGTIKDRDVPINPARFGESPNKTIIPANYYKHFKSLKKGILTKDANRTVIRSNKAIYQIMKGGKWSVLYSIDKDVHLIARPFVEPAGNESAKKLPDNFIKNAEKRIAKYK